MIFIQNVSVDDIKNGRHFDCGDRAVLIQIVDPGYIFPTPRHKFAQVFQFEFFDIDEDEKIKDLKKFVISGQQAKSLVNILTKALDDRRHVVVHCHAGICRSGAVAEVGIMMGFTDTYAFRLPNHEVKYKMMSVLGLTYDRNEKEELTVSDGGIIIAVSNKEMNNINKEYTNVSHS